MNVIDDPWRLLTVALVLSFLTSACAFEPLMSASEGSPEVERPEDLTDTVSINRILVSPVTIHPGDEVLLRDPEIHSNPREPRPFYFWGACGGELADEEHVHARSRIWIAPDEPGIYEITISEVNFRDSLQGTPSRIVELCVAPEGEQTCPARSGRPLELTSLAASPDQFYLGCGEGCDTEVTAEVDAPDAAALEFQWVAPRGAIVGSGPSVAWQLPDVSCCTDTYSISVTICDQQHHAATGFAKATVTPE